jgi:hypothetical protein
MKLLSIPLLFDKLDLIDKICFRIRGGTSDLQKGGSHEVQCH